MTGHSIAKIKTMFLDRAGVTRRLDKGTVKAFRTFGGRVRLTARHSIRKPPKKARKGGKRSPYDRTGRLKKNIFFAVDPDKDSLIVGPIKLDGVATENAPELLEYGGMGRDSRTGESVEYPEYPYMTPAFEKELPRLDDAFRDAVT